MYKVVRRSSLKFSIERYKNYSVHGRDKVELKMAVIAGDTLVSALDMARQHA